MDDRPVETIIPDCNADEYSDLSELTGRYKFSLISTSIICFI